MERGAASGGRHNLPAYLLELLDDDERQRIKQLLAQDVSLQVALSRLREAARAASAADAMHLAEERMEALLDATLDTEERHAALGHLIGCRDCRFTLSVVLAARAPEGEAGLDQPAAPRSIWRPPWPRIGLAAAALVSIGVLGVRWNTSRQAVRTSLVVRLAAERAEDPEVSLRASADHSLTLLIETVFPSPAGHWTLVREAGDEIASGDLQFDPRGPGLRVAALTFPPSRLVPGPYLLILRAPDGSLERQWRFRVTP